MAVKVLLPGLLATQAGGENRFEIDAPTVGAVLRALPISDLIFDETGALRGLVNVYVDQRDMRERDGLDTALEGDEEIRIVAAVAGRIPVSVATRKRFLSELLAKLTIPSVERMCVRSLPKAMHWLAQPHSGWTSSSASGASRCQRSMSAGRMPAWTWHSPIQIFSLRPVTRSSQMPRYMSGRKRISLSAGIASMTAFALPDVQQ